MENMFFLILAPWLVFVIFAIFACLLLKFAKKRKGIAFAFGVLVQMFAPDPMVEQTIKMVQVDKRLVKENKKQGKDKLETK
jgi:hypothetical protein